MTIPEPNSGCLLWLGAPTGQLGHGQIKIGGKNRMASHVALELAGRPLPSGMFACHSCDNPACVNADHLFFGTQYDNVCDAIKKGRHDISGLRLGSATTADRQINAIGSESFSTATAVSDLIARQTGLPLGTVYGDGRVWLY